MWAPGACKWAPTESAVKPPYNPYGKEIVSLDGQPWLQEIQRFAEAHVLSSRDPNSRLNAAVSGQYFQRQIRPSKPTLLIGFADGTVVQVPWGAVTTALDGGAKQPLTSTRLNGLCKAKPSSAATGLIDRSTPPKRSLFQVIPDPELHFPTIISDPPSLLQTNVHNADVWKLDLSYSGRSAIIRIPTFSPDASVSLEIISSFVVEFSNMTMTVNQGIKDGRYDRLILDVRGNGGGIITLSNFVSWCLTKDVGQDGAPLNRPSRSHSQLAVLHHLGFPRLQGPSQSSI